MPLVVQKRLKNTIEWIHDFQRTGTVLVIDGLDQDLFRAQLTISGGHNAKMSVRTLVLLKTYRVSRKKTLVTWWTT